MTLMCSEFSNFNAPWVCLQNLNFQWNFLKQITSTCQSTLPLCTCKVTCPKCRCSLTSNPSKISPTSTQLTGHSWRHHLHRVLQLIENPPTADRHPPPNISDPSSIFRFSRPFPTDRPTDRPLPGISDPCSIFVFSFRPWPTDQANATWNFSTSSVFSFLKFNRIICLSTFSIIYFTTVLTRLHNLWTLNPYLHFIIKLNLIIIEVLSSLENAALDLFRPVNNSSSNTK